jgi:hypothetical protein
VIEDIRWAEVVKIEAVGFDAIGPYEICVNFTHADGTWVPIYVHTPGYKQLVRNLHQRFPTISADWYERMMGNPDWHVEQALYERDGEKERGP